MTVRNHAAIPSGTLELRHRLFLLPRWRSANLCADQTREACTIPHKDPTYEPGSSRLPTCDRESANARRTDRATSTDPKLDRRHHPVPVNLRTHCIAQIDAPLVRRRSSRCRMHSSRLSSADTTPSHAGWQWCRRQWSIVVFPAWMPPATTMFTAPSTAASRNRASCPVRLPSSTRSASRAARSTNLRMCFARLIGCQ